MENSPFANSMLTVERPSQILFKKVKEQPMDTKKDIGVKLSQMLPNDSKESVTMKVEKDRSTPRHLQDQTNTPMPLEVPKLKKKMSHQNGKLKFTAQKELSSHSATSNQTVLGKLSFGSENDSQLTNSHQNTLRIFGSENDSQHTNSHQNTLRIFGSENDSQLINSHQNTLRIFGSENDSQLTNSHQNTLRIFGSENDSQLINSHQNTLRIFGSENDSQLTNSHQNTLRIFGSENDSQLTNSHQNTLRIFGSENDSQLTNSHQKTLRIFSCQRCEKSFRHKSSLKQHCISIHEQSKYKCPICLKEFNRISSLNTHKSIHDVEKKFKCGHCGKAFHQKGNLKHHIFTHVSIRPYVCNRCGKSFHQPSNLRTHMCVHDVMDPLPLAVILIEGEELAKMNFKINWNLPNETNNWNLAKEPTYWNSMAEEMNGYSRVFMGPIDQGGNLDNFAKDYSMPVKYDEGLDMLKPPFCDMYSSGNTQRDLYSDMLASGATDKQSIGTQSLTVKPLSSLQQLPTSENHPITSGQSIGGNKATYPSMQCSRTIKLSSSTAKTKLPLSSKLNTQLSHAGIIPASSVEQDAISYCFHCNLAFTHKVNAASFESDKDVQCPSCGQNLYTRVVPKCEQGFSVGAVIDDKFRKLQQALLNFHTENMHV